MRLKNKIILIFMGKFIFCKNNCQKIYIFNILYILLSDRQETVVDCLLCIMPFVSGERLICYELTCFKPHTVLFILEGCNV